ncbi:PRC-barrel domain-containing protein [Corynebacterium confusum]|uniref:PRC-barrel domain-containing protein n=1 Tax=Corynebacterium confusum TaxID=71254 RepID=UPI0025B48D2A|nr:PRC-barrel domain-containing protein [Corynebacterium confusum]WJY89441.1 PRC-barrel domain protein [Corynebacterium confusum]
MSKDIKDLLNATAYDKDGEKLGDVNEIFVDDNTGKPTFVDVKHGLFGMNSSLVPLRGHDFNGDELRLAFSKDRIKDAPDFDSDSALTPEQQNDIFRHYGLEQAEDRTEYRDVNREQDRTNADTAGVAGERTAANNDGSMIRSEEQLNVNKEQVIETQRHTEDLRKEQIDTDGLGTQEKK